MGGQLIEVIKTFYSEVNVCVKVDGKLSDCSAIGVRVRRMCDVIVVV